jgi:glycosyltransferase involved in cell wall biosynthesis
MKVLHVYRTFFPDTQGGLEEVIRQICLNASPHGVESRVFALSPGPDPVCIQVDGVEVVRVKQSFEIASCGFCFAGLAEFSRQVAWADVLHYHFPWPWGDVMHMLAGRGKATVVTYHSDIVRQQTLQFFYRPLMYRFLGSASRIVATSPNYFSTSDVLNRFSDRVEVIPIGIEESSYPTAELTNSALERTRVTYGEGFFLFVGVLRYYKGLHILLEAVKDASYRVVIVGSGPVEEELRGQAKRLDLDNVVFGGYVDDDEKMALFELSRAVVFPSYLRAEAFGVTLLEGAMSGKPLISAEIGSGTSHINIHEETGLVVPPGCPRALREAMDFLYYNPRRARQMGGRARQRYENLFTGKTMGARYAATYRQVLQEREQGASHTSRSVEL